MSIIVKGMQMPENCTRCDYIGLNVAIGCPVMSGTNGRATDCPLGALPDKHGRLVDADALEKILEKIPAADIKNMGGQAYVLVKLSQVFNVIDNQPTIEPERKKGKWIYGESEAGNDGYYCSKCGNFVPWKYDEYDIDFIKEFLFCNKCGAEMRTPVETARDIVHEAINNSVWSDTVDTAKMHKVVDDKYAEIRGDANADAES